MLERIRRGTRKRVILRGRMMVQPRIARGAQADTAGLLRQ